MAPGTRWAQRGVALAVVLVLLAVGSLIAVTGMTQAIVDERIAGNQRQIAEIFPAAEAGLLRAGRWWREESSGERHDQLFWNDPDGAMAALQGLDRVIRPGLSWSVQELRFDGDEVLMRVRGEIADIGTVREVQGRYRRPADGDLADADGTLFGWSELLQH